MPSSALTPAIGDEIARLGSADIMVGIPSYRNAATIGHVVRAAQAGLVQYFPDLRPVLVNADAGSPDGTARVVVETEPPGYVEQILLVHPTNRLARVSLTYPEVDGVGGKGAALRTLFEMAAALRVEALVVVDSDLRSIVPEWIELLAGPIMKGGYDYVAPLYSRHKYDGTITNTVTYPVTRALYGHRIRQPIGGDFGVSGDLIRHYLAQDTWTPDVSRFGIDIWMTTTALTGGFAVCQTRLGAKIHDPKDPGSDLGPMFRQVVGTLLSMARDNADRWLAITGSHEVPAYGFERYAEPAPLEVNTLRLLSQFHSGSLTASDTWRQMLRPDDYECVMELAGDAGRLAEAAANKLGIDAESGEGSAGHGGLPSTDELSDAVADFQFPDDLWARVFYDLLVSASFGELPTERLVAAFVPIYFGRVGRFIIENRRLSGEQAEDRVERQAREFELLKPYLVEQWRSAAERAE
jgi:glucosylglycerate synthase